MIGGNYIKKYNNADSPKVKINYSYSSFRGKEFLEEFLRDRKDYIFGNCIVPEFLGKSKTHTKFNEWQKKINNNDFSFLTDLNLLLKRFEVTKKIYNNYDFEFRKTKDSSFEDLTLYVHFSHLLLLSYKKKKKLQYLNALLKVNDILQSNYHDLDAKVKCYASYCFQEELTIVKKLLNKSKI